MKNLLTVLSLITLAAMMVGCNREKNTEYLTAADGKKLKEDVRKNQADIQATNGNVVQLRKDVENVHTSLSAQMTDLGNKISGHNTAPNPHPQYVRIQSPNGAGASGGQSAFNAVEKLIAEKKKIDGAVNKIDRLMGRNRKRSPRYLRGQIKKRDEQIESYKKELDEKIKAYEAEIKVQKGTITTLEKRARQSGRSSAADRITIRTLQGRIKHLEDEVKRLQKPLTRQQYLQGFLKKSLWLKNHSGPSFGRMPNN